jgi:hypothetical protein
MRSTLFPIAMSLSSLLCSSALAEGTASFLIRNYDTGTLELRQLLEMKVADIQNGISWTNIYLNTVRNEAEIYCPPAKVALTGGQIMDMLRRAIEEHPEIGSQPFGLAILIALKTTFPCP